MFSEKPAEVAKKKLLTKSEILQEMGTRPHKLPLKYHPKRHDLRFHVKGGIKRPESYDNIKTGNKLILDRSDKEREEEDLKQKRYFLSRIHVDSSKKPVNVTEPFPDPPSERTYTYRYGLAMNAIKDEEVPRTPIVSVAWGWNSQSRAGNLYMTNIAVPRQIAHSHEKNYIACGAGLHHSLIVDEDGIMYSFGDGRHGQLGHGNEFNDVNATCTMQAYPKKVSPSGIIKEGRDMKFVQVDGGNTFSIGREVAPEEGVYLFKHLHELEMVVKEIQRLYPESEVVQKAWAVVRQERFKITKIATGKVVAFGTGEHGQLGLGKYALFSPYPRIIPKLAEVIITQIAVGNTHVLAISSTGTLYSWGSGKSGRLGHKDFADRFEPCIVRFFEPYHVEYCAAGENHSAVLTTTRRGPPREVQIKEISTFGRGAHGRLGNGTNCNKCEPQPVTQLPPSLEGYQIKQVACGGAHTLALFYKPMNKSLANPWGLHSVVMAWGYGRNGQLGNGKTVDSFIPVKVLLQKLDIVNEISAGRSWSLARTITGKTLSWGKGLRGQLGQNEDIKQAPFSIIPRAVASYASLIDIKSSVYHNVALGVQRKYLNENVSIDSVKNHSHHAYDPLVQQRLRELDCDIMYSFDCCKRNIAPGATSKNKQRYMCLTCDVHCMCSVCAKLCHIGHQVVERNPVESGVDPYHRELQRKQEFRDLQQETIKKISQNYDKKMKLLIKQRLREEALSLTQVSGSTTKIKKKLGINTKEIKAVKVPSMWDKLPVLLAIKRYKREKERLLKIKRSKIDLLSAGGSTVVEGDTPGSPARSPSRDQLTSEAPETLSRSPKSRDRSREGFVITSKTEEYKDITMYNRQPVCSCSLFSGTCKLSATIPETDNEDEDVMYNFKYHMYVVRIQRLARRYLGRCRRYAAYRHLAEVRHEVSQLHYYSNILAAAWQKFDRSLSQIKQEYELRQMAVEEDNIRKYYYKYYLQCAIGGMRALEYGLKTMFSRVSIAIPRTTSTSFYSLTFTWCSIRDLQLKMHPKKRLSTAILAEITANWPRYSKTEGEVYDKDLSLFLLKYVCTPDMYAHYKGLQEKKELIKRLVAEEEERKKKEIMEKRENKKKLIAAAAAMRAPKKEVPVAQEEENEVEVVIPYIKLPREPHGIFTLYDDDIDADPQPFDMYAKITQPVPRRRHSITDPCELTARFRKLRESTELISFMRRRNSDPTLYKPMHPTERRTLPHIVNSLDLYYVRLGMLHEVTHEKYQGMWAKESRQKKLKYIKRLYNQAFVSPRLPVSMYNDILRPRGGARRRRTIAEPERYAKQLHVLFETRNNFQKLCTDIGVDEGCNRRRRSFDYGEEYDHHHGVTRKLGYQYENYDYTHVPTMSELYKDRMIMDSRMGFSGFVKKEVKEGDLLALWAEENKAKEEGKNETMIEKKVSTTKVVKGGSSSMPRIPRANDSKSKTKSVEQAAPVAAPVTTYANVWQEYFSEEGYTYYYNPSTGESTWEYPSGDIQLCQQYQDDAGNWYWFNTTTYESSWV